MRESDIIQARRSGKNIFYSLGAKIDGRGTEDIILDANNFLIRISPKVSANAN